MFEIEEYVVCKKDVCKIIGIKKNHILGKDYYILAPIDDESLKIELPTENRLGFIRKIISKSDAIKIINSVKNIEVMDNINDKMLENEYKKMLNTGDHEDLIKIIKTTYLRNDKRIRENKKISEKDYTYFKKAEKLLYNELSVALSMTYDETKEYIIKTLEKTTEM